MPNYLVETFLARGDADHPGAREMATRAAIDALRRDGSSIRCIGALYVPDDEICLYTFDAPTADDVERLADRAGLRVLRIVEAMPSLDGIR